MKRANTDEQYADTKGEWLFADTHCHLDFDQLSHRLSAVLEACASHKIAFLMVPSANPRHWSKVLGLQEVVRKIALPKVYGALGVHPWFVEQVNENDLNILVEYIEKDQGSYIRAIGELGLDANHADLSKQTVCLNKQLFIASSLNLPVILHSVKTHDLVLSCLKKHNVRAGVVHGFSGSYEQAMSFVRQGLYIGVGGVITFERAKKTRNAIAKLPLESIVLETDSPDMKMQGVQNSALSPVNLLRVFDVLKQVRPESPEQLMSAIWRNSCQLYGVT